MNVSSVAGRTAWPGNDRWLGVDGPYAHLYEQVPAADQQDQGGADAIASPQDRLRWPAGTEVEEAIRLRSSLGDAEWESYVLEHTRLDW